MKTKRVFLLLVATALVIAIFLAQSGEKNVIKIGVVVPLTGNQGFVGEGIRDAVLLALDKHKDSRHNYEVIFEDAQIDPKSAASAAQKLISIDHVDAILSAYAPIGNAIAPIAESAHVLHIGIAFDEKVAEGTYNFINFTSPETAARTFLLEMQKRGLKKLGIFRLNNQGIIAIYTAIKELSGEYGVTITSDEQFQPGERDFRNIITKSSQADIYALLSIPPELDILSKQMQDLGLKNQTTVIYFELSANKNLYNSLWFVGYGEPTDVFQETYKQKYGKDITFGVPNAYDTFDLLVSIAEQYTGSGKPSTAFLAAELQKVNNFQGVLGTLSVNEIGIIDSPVSIKIMQDGKSTQIK